MILSRFKQRFSSSYEPMDEFRISRFANMIFERIMDLERWFIKAGLTMPVGGSLLMIAKKCR